MLSAQQFEGSSPTRRLRILYLEDSRADGPSCSRLADALLAVRHVRRHRDLIDHAHTCTRPRHNNGMYTTGNAARLPVDSRRCWQCVQKVTIAFWHDFHAIPA